ncbi:potassium-transporting ATPase subunit F [Larkinella ripae]
MHTPMITLIFCIALLVFAYMLYVLIKPEKF